MNRFQAPKRKPLVVGHRGVPRLHQENTLAGFRRAVELGLPAIELDVVLTADRKPVVFHDADTERLTGVRGTVMDMTWDQVSRLRVRRTQHVGTDASGARRDIRYEREEPISLLEEVLSEVKGKLAINVELKLGLPRWWQLDVASEVARVIRRVGVEDQVIVSSFDPRKLRRAHRDNPNIAIGFCFTDNMLNAVNPLLGVLPRLPIQLGHEHGKRNPQRVLTALLGANVIRKILGAGSTVVGAEHTLITPATVSALHRRGMAIGTHNVFPLDYGELQHRFNDRTMIDEVHRLIATGVDWIESDDPERLQRVVG